MLERLIATAFRRAAHRSLGLAPHAGFPPAPAQPVFLYLHVPFCEVLCPFCSFHRVRHERDKARTYFAALRQEIRLFHARGFRFSGVYVGGGTPTVEPGELAETLDLLSSLGPLAAVSVETNPGDLVPAVLDRLVTAGVTRLSIGVQSFDDARLQAMQRYDKYGSGAAILEHIAVAAGRFPTLNVDMIFNLPGQTEAELDRDLDCLQGSAANQVSYYPLMSVPSAERAMQRGMGVPDPRWLPALYRRINARLRPEFVPASAWCFNRGGGGIDEYVIESSDYLGLGSGAFSYLDGRLHASTFSIHGYVERIARGQCGLTGMRTMGPAERMRYDLLMRLFGLRLERRWVTQRYGGAFERALRTELTLLRVAGAVSADADGWRLTDRGMLLWVVLMAAFFESVNEVRAQMRMRIGEELRGEAEAVVPLDAIGGRKGSDASAQGANSGPLSM